MPRRPRLHTLQRAQGDRLWRIALWSTGGLASLVLGLIVGFHIWAPQVVRQFNLVRANTAENTIIYDHAGAALATLEGTEDRHTVPLARISPFLQKAVVAIEDRRFFAHRGMDPVRLAGAVWADMKALGYRQGASTITQQLVKLTLLSSERTLSRKVREIFMALALEWEFPKIEILEFYLNRVYLGYGVYGVEKAARSYFHKSAAELTLHEAAWLAALIKKPEGYLQLPSGVKDAGGATLPVERLAELAERTRQVLDALLELGWVSLAEYRQGRAEPLRVYRPEPEDTRAAYFVQQVMKEMRDTLGVSQVSGRGFRVYTTLNLAQQEAAEAIMAEAMLDHPTAEQAAIVSMDTHTGAVRALVGGLDFRASQFNRATQALRQPGSAFKPILFAAALDDGFRPDSTFVDEPVRYSWGEGVAMPREMGAALYLNDESEQTEGPPETYAPRNFNARYGEPRSVEDPRYALDTRLVLQRALERSSNVIAVQLLDQIGMNPLLQLTRRYGITLRPQMGLCVALGCSEVTLAELTSAYASFANGGLRIAPTTIRKITNSRGDLLYKAAPNLPEQIVSPWTAFQMRRMLTNVVLYGTGARARMDRPVGGKTGTNDGPRDAWFIGFTPDVVTGVWVGNDDNRVMPDEQGGRTPARIWVRFMRQVLADQPLREFPEPDEEYTEADICTVTGQRAGPWCPVTRRVAFRAGELGDATCDLHKGDAQFAAASLNEDEERLLLPPWEQPAGAGTFARQLEGAFAGAEAQAAQRAPGRAPDAKPGPSPRNVAPAVEPPFPFSAP
ncbi:MAG: transglycosylase domain-containing protein [Candidatus Lambdaproteobacteria bacterium]|nr:transglycosylase domain-containing protein [Candidatus Lambdaproteobacteria bacterium]